MVWGRTVPFLFQNPGEFLVEILSGSNVKNSQRFFLRVHRIDDAVRNALVIEMVRSKPVESSLQFVGGEWGLRNNQKFFLQSILEG